nr:protein transport protein SEC31 homolog B-like [Tanacetum cinerariifolium]
MGPVPCSSLVGPDTQLYVIWDMRNTMSPLRELVGHDKGVVAMSWCPSDSSYLLTCAKDNRTICWDTGSGGSLVLDMVLVRITMPQHL